MYCLISEQPNAFAYISESDKALLPISPVLGVPKYSIFEISKIINKYQKHIMDECPLSYGMQSIILDTESMTDY
jgi:hypothetical protein